MPCFNSYLLGISKFAMSHCHWCYTTFFLAFSSFMPLFPSLGAIAARYLNWATQVIMFINIWLLPPFFFGLGNKGNKKKKENNSDGARRNLKCFLDFLMSIFWASYSVGVLFSHRYYACFITQGSISLSERRVKKKKKKPHTTNFTRVLIIWQKNK